MFISFSTQWATRASLQATPTSWPTTSRVKLSDASGGTSFARISEYWFEQGARLQELSDPVSALLGESA